MVAERIAGDFLDAEEASFVEPLAEKGTEIADVGAEVAADVAVVVGGAVAAS